MYDKKIIKQIKESYNSEKATQMLDESKFSVLTEDEFLDQVFGSFEYGDHVNYYDLLDWLTVGELTQFKKDHNFEYLFNEYLENDQGIFYKSEECTISKIDSVNTQNLYILKLNENLK